MGAVIDMTGQKFGKITVIKRMGSSTDNRATWECICECGTVKTIIGKELREGKIISCGCAKKERIGDMRRTHGKSQKRIYKIWQGVKKRCLNQNFKQFKDYGGRGITVCKEWEDDFQSFYRWSVRNGYNSLLTIDRIDNNGNYSPDNCRWIARNKQNLNKRTNIKISYDGDVYALVELSKKLGVSRHILRKNIVKKSASSNLWQVVERQPVFDVEV